MAAPRKTTFKPRKRPRQARAQATVAAIIEATAHILTEEGYGATTTNKVAAKAGVSIGSLYQYFPSKEALITALVERHIETMNSLIRAELQDLGDSSEEEIVYRLICGLIKAHEAEPELHRVMVEEVPRAGALGHVHEVEESTRQLVARALTIRQEELAITNPELSAFILVQAVESAIHGAVLYHQDFDLDELAAELSKLVLAYLAKD